MMPSDRSLTAGESGVLGRVKAVAVYPHIWKYCHLFTMGTASHTDAHQPAENLAEPLRPKQGCDSWFSVGGEQ